MALDVKIKIYEDGIATIRNDLAVINNQRREFTPVVELKQVEVSLYTLESRISNFQQLIPRPERRRGILNLGGTILNVFSVLRQWQIFRNYTVPLAN